MAVLGFDHINIRTSDIARSVEFYVDIFDFEYRKGELIMGRQPNWLFDKTGKPIIHLRAFDEVSEFTGCIDHVALACDGKAEILERLTTKGIEFSVFENPVNPITQVFIKDPHGVLLELNFPRTEGAAA